MNISERFFKNGVARFSRSTQGWLLPGLLLLAVWAIAIRQSDLEWTINPQYQYGWIVPFLTLILWWRSWPRRPAPGAPTAPFLLPVLVIGFSLFAFPLRIIEEANPDWRLLNYYFVGQALLITVLAVDYSGGRPWLRHFAFPLLFPLIAVPWPSGPERELVQALQRCIASIGVESASWMGWNAVQSGNLIILPQGIVGVNEACSGIRSLQSSLMIALFLGEYFRLEVARRWVLIVVAMGMAFVFNAIRACFLIFMMDQHGAEIMEKFHDPAGLTISLANLIVLWILSNWMEPREASVTEQPSKPRTEILRFPLGWLSLLLAAWLAAEILNQGWYLWYERHTVAGPVWTVRWPLPRPNFKELPIDDIARTFLRYDYGVHGTWKDDNEWHIFFFTWNPSRAAVGLAESHHPDLCLPAAGFKMKEELGVKMMEVNGLTLPVTRYIFQDPRSGRILYAFQAITDDRVRTDVVDVYTEVSSRERRLHSAWIGQRNPGQRSLLVVNYGAENIDEAEAGLRRLLQDTVITKSARGTP